MIILHIHIYVINELIKRVSCIPWKDKDFNSSWVLAVRIEPVSLSTNSYDKVPSGEWNYEDDVSLILYNAHIMGG